MKWHIDEPDRLVVTVSLKEQRSLRRESCKPTFDSDRFMHRLFAALTRNDFTWLPEGCIDDFTSAPMVGILGEAMPGPDDVQDAIGLGLVHVGCWAHQGRLRQMYEPVLRRWAFMDYAITSPQRELADKGRCVWEGGDFWRTQEAAEKALAELIGCGEEGVSP